MLKKEEKGKGGKMLRRISNARRVLHSCAWKLTMGDHSSTRIRKNSLSLERLELKNNTTPLTLLSNTTTTKYMRATATTVLSLHIQLNQKSITNTC